MFDNINLKEASVLAQVLKQGYVDKEGNEVQGKTLEETLEELELIDDLLAIQKSKSLLKNRRGLNKLLRGRIDLSLKDPHLIAGTSNNHLGKY